MYYSRHMVTVKWWCVCFFLYTFFDFFLICVGIAEFAGLEFAGLENDGLKSDGQENDGLEMTD